MHKWEIPIRILQTHAELLTVAILFRALHAYDFIPAHQSLWAAAANLLNLKRKVGWYKIEAANGFIQMKPFAAVCMEKERLVS